ncbi:MAG: hypothetical protein ABSC48_12975 [Terracidiphilus sp.]
MKKLLREALPPVGAGAGPERDLWPAMLRRLDSESAAPATHDHWARSWAWFDGALAASLVGLAALFPAAIPLALYYL